MDARGWRRRRGHRWRRLRPVTSGPILPRTPVSEPGSHRPIRLRRDARRLRHWWCALLALAVVAVGTLVPLGAPPASAGLPGTYSNPLSPLDTPDSDVVRLGSQYYAFSTGDGFFNIPVMTTDNLARWPQTLLFNPDVSEPCPASRAA